MHPNLLTGSKGEMKFTIKSLLAVTFLAAVACTFLYSPHPTQVNEMLRYIEDDISEEFRSSEIPGSYSPVTMDRRRKYLELFSPMEGSYYLQTMVVEGDDASQNELKGIAVMKRVGVAKWKYIFPIYIDGEVLWKHESGAPDPFERRHLFFKKSSSKTDCICPDCSDARDNG